jgi:hypothetical protein
MLREIQLGNNADDYVHQYLDNGGALAARLSALPFAKGQMTTWVPVSTDLAHALRFRAAHTVPHTAAVQAAADYIATYLAQGPLRCAIFEDLLAKPSDLQLPGGLLPWFHVTDEVYYYLLANEANVGEVLNAIRMTYTFRFLCALTAWPPNVSLPADHSETSQFLDFLAGATESIVVGAYDAEGFLVWRQRVAGAA